MNEFEWIIVLLVIIVGVLWNIASALWKLLDLHDRARSDFYNLISDDLRGMMNTEIELLDDIGVMLKKEQTK